MPVKEFLAEFLPPAKRRSPNNSRLFAALRDQQREADMYAPFIKLVDENNLIPGFKIIDTSNHPDIRSLQGKKIRPDPSMYCLDVKIEGNVTQFENLELNFEFKLHDVKDPFRDPDPSVKDRTQLSFESPTDEGKDCRGQLASYVTEWCSRQHRAFAYTVFIVGSKARLIRWDRSGAIVTEKFDYKKNSQPLTDFLWCFVHLDDAGRGKDTTVRIADSEEVSLAREHLSRWEPHHERSFVVFIIKDGGESHEYIGWGPMADADSLIGRATRAYPVYEKSTGKIRFLKNAWRAVVTEKEADLIREMNEAEVRHIPTVIHGGDIEDPYHVTTSHKFQDRSWRCGRTELTERIHHTFMMDFVGHPLSQFKSTKQLTQAVFDAFLAHRDAVEKCGILHRDISGGNVMMTDGGEGILNDWDLAKRVVRPPQDGISRKDSRTGTWRFMSLKNLKVQPRMHLVQDDIESFVYVLLYHALLFAKHTAVGLKYVMKDVFDDYCYHDSTKSCTGGKGKHSLCIDPYLTLGVGFRFINNIPLTRLVLLMLSAVRDWHSFERHWDPLPQGGPDLAADPEATEDPLPLDVYGLFLKNHDKIAAAWGQALASPVWPVGDAASDQLPPEVAPQISSKRNRRDSFSAGHVEGSPSQKRMKLAGSHNVPSRES